MTSTPPDPSPAAREGPALGDLGPEAEPRDDTAPEPGHVVAGKYRVERVLGSGGMGVVVAATHLVLDQRVAIKMLRARVARQPEHVRRFLREAKAASRLTSEHVARVLDVGTLESGAPFMVLEHLVGADLGALLETRGALPVGRAVDYVLQACQAVAEAHALGIVHRDLKPSNLFLTKRADGSPLVKVLDFGIAKAIGVDAGADAALTSTGAAMGSPRYMSPEQIRNAKDVDARADVWALGVVLHELCAGSPPFGADAVPALCAMIVTDPPTRLRDICPDAPVELERIVLDCLEKDRRRRVADVATLVARLAPLASDVARSRASVESVRRVLHSGAAQTRGGFVVPATTPGEPIRALSDTEPERELAGDAGGSGTAEEVVRPPPRDRGSETAAPWSSARAAPPARRRWIAAAIAMVALAGAWMGWSRVRGSPAPVEVPTAAIPTGGATTQQADPVITPSLPTADRDGTVELPPASAPASPPATASAAPTGKVASHSRTAATQRPAPSATAETPAAPPSPPVEATKRPAVDPMGDRK